MTELESIPGPAYRIVTSRLVIRCWNPSDAMMMGVSIDENLDHLRPWLPWASEWPISLQDRIELLRQWRGNFDSGIDFEYGFFNPSETRLLGAGGLHTRLGLGVRGIGYWIHKDYINQGYATEAAGALTKVAFEIDHVSRVEIHCHPKNIRSASVPKKLGFIHEATLHKRDMGTDGDLRDRMVWSIFEENYCFSPAANADIQAFDAIGRRII